MFTRRDVLALGAGVVALSSIAACQPSTPTNGGFTDAAGRHVSIPANVRRILAAGPPASVLLYALAPEKMVGWVRAPSDEQKALIAAPYRDLPEHGRLTGRGNTANLEQIVAFQPDLIVDSGAVDETYASLADRVQEQTGIPYVLLDGSFARTAEALRTFGAAIGVDDKATRLAAYADEAFALVRDQLSATPPSARPSVYYGRGPDGLETGLSGSINVELLDIVGCPNVAAVSGEGGLTNVSPEQVLAWNPDVIIAQDRRFRTSLLSSPQWAGLRAVQAQRVHVPPNAPFGWFDAPPGINRLIGVQWLLTKLYDGDAAALRTATNRFYSLFYHMDISKPQLDALLNGA